MTAEKIVRDAIAKMKFKDEYLAIMGMMSMAVRLGAMSESLRDELREDLKTKYDTL